MWEKVRWSIYKGDDSNGNTSVRHDKITYRNIAQISNTNIYMILHALRIYGSPICYTRTYCIHLYIYYSYVLHIIFIILKFIVCIYLCQLNRGLRGQVVFPGPSCSRGVLRRPPAAGCVYMPVLFTHARALA